MLNTPGNIDTLSVPEIPQQVADRVSQYLQVRSAQFCDWDPQGQGMLISTRFGDTFQLHQVAQPGAARRQLTFYREPVTHGRYCPDPTHHGFLFSMDVGGGEYYQIYYFDIATGHRRLLTDGESKNGAPLWNHKGNLFAFNSTRRNERDHDIYVASVDGADTAKRVCTVQGYWIPLAWSPDDKQLLLLDYISATKTHCHLLNLETEEVTPLFAHLEGEIAFGDAEWSHDGKGLYFIADIDSEFMHLHYWEQATGNITALTRDIPWNVFELALSPNGKLLAYATNEDGIGKLYLMDTNTQKTIKQPELPVGVLSNLRFSPDSSQLAFGMSTAQFPTDVYAMNVTSSQLTRWTDSEVGGLRTDHFPVPNLIRYPSFDEMQIPAFYFKPTSNSDRPYPVVIYIHGGPESQYHPGFSSVFQYWLNELDIAVIAPNVRGSSGYGKTYIKLDNGYLREDSVKDIGALLDWIAKQPELDEKRVCVYGGSYGGYMVLASLCHYSERLRAGVDIVGISNFVTFLKNTKSYRRDLRRVEYGDERDPDMFAFLEAISPTTQAHRIQKPLFVAQGLNDPRVPATEAEQIVATVKERGIPVWYLLARDEGHGFSKMVNIEYYHSAVSVFLESHLLD